MSIKKKAFFCFGIVLVAVAGIIGCKLNSKKNNINKNTELTYWIRNNSNITALNMDFNDTPFVKKLNMATGINVKYIIQEDSDVESRLELMLASSNMPDIVDWSWGMLYFGGAQKMIDNGYIIRLNELIEKNSPNFLKLLTNNPRLKESISSYDGSCFNYPFVQLDKSLENVYGLMVRKDWLDELGIGVPETISEWETMLRLFKNEKNASAPLCIQTSCQGFMGAFGVIDDFYRDDYTIKYGRIEPGYKEYLTLMNKWYDEGLLTADYGNINPQSIERLVCTNQAGAIAAYAGSGMRRITEIMVEKNSKFRLAAAPCPTIEKGKIPEFGMNNESTLRSGTAITGQCKSPELAAKYLDYGYSAEGHLLYNFGIEGESYTLKNGLPTYTGAITDNGDNLSFGQALAMYARSSYFGPFEQDKRYLSQYYELPEQREATFVWNSGDEDRHTLPCLTYPPGENDELDGIMASIKKYTDEMDLKFILGAEPLDNFDKYVEDIKSMNIDRAIEIQDKAYKRYRQK